MSGFLSADQDSGLLEDTYGGDVAEALKRKRKKLAESKLGDKGEDDAG